MFLSVQHNSLYQLQKHRFAWHSCVNARIETTLVKQSQHGCSPIPMLYRSLVPYFHTCKNRDHTFFFFLFKKHIMCTCWTFKVLCPFTAPSPSVVWLNLRCTPTENYHYLTYLCSSLPAPLLTKLSTKNVEQLWGEEKMAYLNTYSGEQYLKGDLSRLNRRLCTWNKSIMHLHNFFNQLSNQNTQICLTTHILRKNVTDYH